jgi:hypothetical protein
MEGCGEASKRLPIRPFTIQRIAVALFLVFLASASVPAKDGQPPAAETPKTSSDLEASPDADASEDSQDSTDSEGSSEQKTGSGSKTPSDSQSASDPESSLEKKWEITLAWAVQRVARQNVYQAPILEVAYYLRDDVLLDFIAPWTTLRQKHRFGSKSAMGNLQAGIQWQFLDEETIGISALLFPRLEFNAPGSSAVDDGLVNEGMNFSLPLQIGRTFGPVGIALEAGYSFIEYQIDESFYSLASVYSLTDRMDLLLQVLGAVQTDYEEGDVALTFGIRWTLTDRFALIAAAGKGLYDSRDNPVEFLSSVGVEFSY